MSQYFPTNLSIPRFPINNIPGYDTVRSYLALLNQVLSMNEKNLAKTFTYRILPKNEEALEINL